MLLARSVLLGTAMALALIAPPDSTIDADQHQHGEGRGLAPNSELVRQVREATQNFQDPSTLGPDYALFAGCVSGGTREGAMGVHYVNKGFIDDGMLDPAKPEAVLYEFRNGKPHLLGVEFIVDATFWDAHNEGPPTLLGQVFTYTSSPNRYRLDPFYSLHVWAWRDNPSGTFVDWNPNVSCDSFNGVS
jgi:hypothetical protein